MGRKIVTTKIIAIASTFAGLYAVLRIIPTFPMIGVAGASFSAADIVAPLYGLILGPVIGPLSVIMGTTIGFFGKPPIFGGLDFLPAAVNAFILGLVARRRRAWAAAVFAVLLAAFIAHPWSLMVVRVAGAPIPFHWMHVAAFIALITPASGVAAARITSVGAPASGLAWGTALLVFMGTMAQHTMGGLLWETIYGAMAGVSIDTFHTTWLGIFFLYPFERGFIVIMATIVGAASIAALKSAGLMLTLAAETKL